MTADELADILKELDLTQVKAAEYLGVNQRTFRRWINEPGSITGPAAATLRAWRKLNALTLPWKPGDIDLGDINPEYQDGLKKLIQKAIADDTKEIGPFHNPYSLTILHIKTVGRVTTFSIESGIGKAKKFDIVYPSDLREIIEFLTERESFLKKPHS